MKLKVDKLIYGGKGLARLNGKAIFVPYTAPGDMILAREIVRKKGYSEAKLERIIEPSKHRIKPKCRYFGRCGGCDWQHVDYETQLNVKKGILEENLQKIGRIKKPNIDEVIPSPPWNYRNRAQFKVSNGKVGFYEKDSHNVVDIDRCLLLKKDISDIPRKLKKLLGFISTEPDEFHVYSSSKGEVLLKIVFNKKFNKIDLTLEKVREILGLNVVGFGIYKSNAENLKRIKFFGRDFTYETVGSKYRFRVSADSFFQVNVFQVGNLINEVLRTPESHPFLLAGDIYCGVGTLTIPVGRYVNKAFGIESNFSAVSDALYNKDINGLRNVSFSCRQAEDSIDTVRSNNPDLIVVDPPRSGLNRNFIEAISKLPRLRNVVYVSCNPSTLARDIAIFHQHGINMERAKLIDMFPQTYHIETIAYLRKVRHA
ncbi:MAG: 23S rRNA (uracil(1939)-C(5))-methyltransferase RlmD [Nitrospiraceae bacterium]|nr:23S rRNA (uracil(1939)-C(5))-methyltransferase RlmD [Nitrospiraceae bacterium]